MSERNEHLVRLLAADAPASRDLAFELAVAARIERERFRRGVAMNVTLALASVIVLATLMPELSGLAQSSLATYANMVIAAALFVFTLLAQRWVARRA
jgi:hypothetical protein